ncbi:MULTISPECIES: YceI family protein [unclassified Saccharicrinis]|uniref:YceI family protein n=1 Tax=unclassified Saccharicrinis TaxID=2646859 RepID=UPI003D331BA6
MKTMLLLALSFSIFSVNAQKYFTRTGNVIFFSHAPMEDIKAENSQVAAILNGEDGSLTFALLIKSFEFEKALMQEHFNENYLESDDFPKANFKGEIIDFSRDMLQSGKNSEVSISGQLTIHGVTQNIETLANLAANEDGVRGTAQFIVKPEDYNIKIPKAVRNNIAKEIEVTVTVDLKPR